MNLSLKITTSLMLLVLLFLVLALVAGGIYQQFSTANDRMRFPVPGELIRVGDMLMQIPCEGEDSPNFVVEHNGGSPPFWPAGCTVSHGRRASGEEHAVRL